MRKLVCIPLAATMMFGFGGCMQKNTASSNTSKITSGEFEGIAFEESDEKTNYVKIEMENGDLIIIELYPDTAPITVDNFQNLVYTKFYDGIIFHRVIKNFMIQGGDPKGNGTGGSSKNIKGEFAANGVKNDLKHTRGVISMARREYPMDSASSQFFICQVDYPSLDGMYAAFGKVIAGMSTVDKIADVRTDYYNKPLTEQKMNTVRFVTVKTNG